MILLTDSRCSTLTKNKKYIFLSHKSEEKNLIKLNDKVIEWVMEAIHKKSFNKEKVHDTNPSPHRRIFWVAFRQFSGAG